MKKIIVFLLTAFLFMFPMTAFAGQWKHDSAGWWYQNDDGSYKTGWYQDVDNKWYYFNNNTGYMLMNTITPDGYKIGEDGTWIKEDAMNMNLNNNYERSIDLKITAFTYPGGIDVLDNEVNVKVYFNSMYDNIYTGKISIDGFEVSKDGAAYIKFGLDSKDIGLLHVKCRYYLRDGSQADMEWNLFGNFENPGDTISTKLFKLYETSITSVEVWIDKAE